jgi:hypothetical protein
VSRAPSPVRGVASDGEASSASSAGVTPPSTLLRTHAPDHVPPPASVGKPRSAGLCRLSSAPCCDVALPDVISIIRVKELGPLPRRVLLVLGPFLPRRLRPRLSFDRLGTRDSPCAATSTGCLFRGCSHSLMFRLPHLLGPQVAPTATARSPSGGRALYTTQDSSRYRIE